MSKVTLRQHDTRLDLGQWGVHHSHDHIMCDLARPTVELQALAALMATSSWIAPVVIDATLYFKNEYETAYVLQERALTTALVIARGLLADALDKFDASSLETVPDAIYTPEYTLHHRGAMTNVNTDAPLTFSSCDGVQTVEGSKGSYVMPEGHYGPGFVVHRSANGLFGYFLMSNGNYDHVTRPLAASILAMILPQAGVGECMTQSYSQMPIANPIPELRDHGAAAHRMATGLIAMFKAKMRALPFEGRPSTFLEEDDDARDALAARMAAGATITWERLKDAEYHDRDGNWNYYLDDGEMLSREIVDRLRNTDVILPEDGKYEQSHVLVINPKHTTRTLSPRDNAVSFNVFQDYCSYRRHPDDGCGECINAKNGSYSNYCQSRSCPITTQVYSGEEDSHSVRIFHDDPAFDDHDLDTKNDPLVTADHRNTERSFAWKAAGRGRVAGVVNQVLNAHYSYGAPMLLESHHARSIEDAVKQGYLEIDQRMDIGIVARPTPALLAQIEAQRVAA